MISGEDEKGDSRCRGEAGVTGHSPTAQRCPLALNKRWEPVGSCFCQSSSLQPQPWPSTSSQAPGRVMESSALVLNRGLDAQKASAATCLGRGCQEESSDGTTSQHLPQHSRHTAWRQLLSAQGGQHGAGNAWSEGPGARGSITPWPTTFFLCLAIFKAEVLLAKSFRGGGERVGSQREPSC